MSAGYQLSASSAFYAWRMTRKAIVHGQADGKRSLPKTVIGEWLAGSKTQLDSLVAVPGNHDITPKTGALTVEGRPPSVVRLVNAESEIIEDQGPAIIVTDETATILDGVTLRATGTVSELARSRPVLPWLDSAAVFVPKSIREPFVGDLREDMTERLAAGWSPTRVKWVAISQVAVLVVRWLWSTGWFRSLRGGGS